MQQNLNVSPRHIALAAAAFALLCTSLSAARAQTSAGQLRPPSVPLVTHDPYFSIWSASDTLSGSDTRHWTGRTQRLTSLVRIDGMVYRLMGLEPSRTPALPQTGLTVTPTRTTYRFANAQVMVTLEFLSPLLPDDVDVLSRPVTYVTLSARAVDGKSHKVQWYQDAGPELAVNVPTQTVIEDVPSVKDLTALRIGSQNQPVLAKRGDDLRIDWGYLYVAAPAKQAQTAFVTISQRDDWATTGKLSGVKRMVGPSPAQNAPTAALTFDLGSVDSTPSSRMLMLAYDDEYSLTYMGRKLRPYWRRNGMDAAGLLQAAARDYPTLSARCTKFDQELMADLTRIGGAKYAQIGALAHRQAIAANKVVADANGAPLMFSKENFSNGCIATVDILYPAAPQLLLLSPTLAKASLVAELNYAASPRWKFPFAPHDLGTYPRADGQVYGGGERTEENQMPVEETGNLMILLAAVAQTDGNTKFCEPFWPQISRWAGYLESKGFDPENQLCTDDFAGHLAHNVNLSAKAIEALGAYSILCRMHGDTQEADRVFKVAQGLADRWVQESRDGDHSRLAFDRPGTWSQKYNLAWDRILGLNLFPASVMQSEMAYYRSQMNPYGVPLDNRRTYTKLDWTIWSGTLTGNKSDLETLASPVYDFLSATSDRNPMSDWYETKEPRQVGFQARAVVGGVFLPLLTDRATWTKWASRDKTSRANLPTWAPLPTPPKVTLVVPTAEQSAQTWSYTFTAPSGEWYAPAFDASAWKVGPGGFGTEGTPGATVRTTWNTSDIWARRTFDVPAGSMDKVQLYLNHDEDAEVYINGILATQVSGYNGTYEPFSLPGAVRRSLKPGRNTIAVHCHQTTGGQYIDAGLAIVEE